MMLRMDERITYEANIAHDIHKLIGSHVVPLVAVDFGVVNLGSRNQSHAAWVQQPRYRIMRIKV